MHLRSIYEFYDYGLAQLDSKSIFCWTFQPIFVRYNNDPVCVCVCVYTCVCMYIHIHTHTHTHTHIQDVSGGIVNILGGDSMDYSE